MVRPLAARISDGDLPPQKAPPRRPVREAEQPWAQANLWPALSESGCGDNIPGSFSRSFADAVVRQNFELAAKHVSQTSATPTHRHLAEQES